MIGEIEIILGTFGQIFAFRINPVRDDIACSAHLAQAGAAPQVACLDQAAAGCISS